MYYYIQWDEFVNICKENNLIDENGFKRPQISQEFKNNKLENPYSWMFTSKEVILEHTLTLEFNYKYENLLRYEYYDFELCKFLGIELKAMYLKIINLTLQLIKLLKDPQNPKLRKSFLKSNTYVTKYIKKGSTMFIFPISMPEFEKPLIPQSDCLIREQIALFGQMFENRIRDFNETNITSKLF